MVNFFHTFICGLGVILLPSTSGNPGKGPATNCLNSTLSRNVKDMFGTCLQKAKNECSGGDNCSIPKTWTKICPCMIEEMQKIFATCCNTTNSCNGTIEERSVTCIYHKSTEVLSSFHTCCKDLNSFWYRRVNKVLFMALKDFLQRKYGESSGIQTSSKRIQSAAAQEICTDLSESEFTETSNQTNNCSTSERILQATRCTFHSLVDHLENRCHNDSCNNDDDENNPGDHSFRMKEQCKSVSDMMFTRWKKSLMLPCDAVHALDEVIHEAVSQQDQESHESTTVRTRMISTTRRPSRGRKR